jgi:hypothetical protein
VLSFCSLLFEAIFFLPDALAFIVIEIGIMLAASRYGFKITALGARGIWQSADFGRESSDEWTYLPWKLFAISLVQGVLIAWLAWYEPVLGTVALFVMSFSFPAAVLVLVQSGSFFQAMNPGHVWDAIRTVGWPYALLCLFLFMLSTGAQIAISMVVPMFDGRIILPIVNFAFIYFGWVMASLLGYVMYQHHDAFGIDVVPGAGVGEGMPVDRRTPAQIAAQRIDAEVAQFITEGDLAAALGTAYEAQRTAAIDDLAAQRRYHRVLSMMPDKQSTMLDQAKRFIPLLMRRDLSSEALKVFKSWAPPPLPRCRAASAPRRRSRGLHLLDVATEPGLRAVRPLGTPIACSITMKRPGSRRTPPTRLRVHFQLLLHAGGDVEVLRQEGRPPSARSACAPAWRP